MAQSDIQVTAGSGTRLRTATKSVSGVTRNEQYHLLGVPDEAAYSVAVFQISTATAASHVLQIMAGASLRVMLTRLRISQDGLAGAVTTQRFDVRRLSTAGTGGTSRTPAALDSADAASGATAMTLPTVSGTAGSTLSVLVLGITATHPIDNRYAVSWEYSAARGAKPIIIPAGTSNGIAVQNVAAIATATVSIEAEFVELPF